MKKIISLLMIVAMIASIAAVNVSAAGQILFTDGFDGDALDPNNWITDAGANAFYVQDGICKGDHNAVVLQSLYYNPEDENPGNKNWSYASFAADFMLYDFDSDSEDHMVGLWWKDYQLGPNEVLDEDGIDSGNIYTLSYEIEKNTLDLTLDMRQMVAEEEETTVAEGETTETTTTVETEDGAEGDYDYVVASVPLPEDIEIKMDYFKPSVHQLGMTVTPNAIYGFFDGRHLLTYKTPTVIGDKKPSPLLLVNGDMMVGFDNVIVASTDYPLFDPIDDNKGSETSVAPTPTQAPVTEIVTQEIIKTEIVTNEEGETEIVTHKEIVSNVVTVPVADTNSGGTAGGTGAATGDMMFIVVAVMIVAIGSAVVVKKVHVK